jgi:hypothetical protein
MIYLLKKIEVNGNADMYGGNDDETEIAISTSIDNLQDYCKKTYNCEASVDKLQKFEWVYFIIVETNLILVL